MSAMRADGKPIPSSQAARWKIPEQFIGMRVSRRAPIHVSQDSDVENEKNTAVIPKPGSLHARTMRRVCPGELPAFFLAFVRAISAAGKNGKQMKAYFLGLAVLALSGCGQVRLTPAGNRVRVTPDPDRVKGCQYIGPVEGRDRMNAAEGAARANAMWRLMNAAGAMGADTVEYRSMDTPLIGATVHGDAYRCRGNPAKPVQ